MGFFKFFASPKGRRFTFYGSLTAAMGAFSIQYFPHTFLASQYRGIVSSYDEGKEKSVNETVLKRYRLAIEVCAKNLQLTDFERGLIEPFVVTGFDLFYIGSTKFKFGSSLGIPTNYNYTSPVDIDRTSIIIRGKPILDWNSKGGQLLSASLVLKDDEQVFGIVREILYIRNSPVYFRSFCSAGCVTIYYILTSTLNSKLRLFYRPLSLRAVLYCITGLFIYGVHSLAQDFCQVSSDGEVDEKLASLGKTFIATGIRFYDKLLKKNIAIRELTGDNSQFTAMGNENFLIRTKSLPLTIRKTFFELKLKQLEENEGKEHAS